MNQKCWVVEIRFLETVVAEHPELIQELQDARARFADCSVSTLYGEDLNGTKLVIVVFYIPFSCESAFIVEWLTRWQERFNEVHGCLALPSVAIFSLPRAKIKWLAPSGERANVSVDEAVSIVDRLSVAVHDQATNGEVERLRQFFGELVTAH